MEANLHSHESTPTDQRTSALVLGAAVAVIIVSAVGIGAATGVIPGALSGKPTEAAHVPLASIQPATSSCASCGTVASIRAVELRAPDAKDGAAQDTTSSILGAAGSIFAGQDFQKSLGKRYAYRVTLRMDDGSYRTVSEGAPPRFAVGQKVRLVDGTLAANS